jgi:pimeloyl-ACP methyl ester carboxylesterase
MKSFLLTAIAILFASVSVMSQSNPLGKASFVESADSIRIAYEVYGEKSPALVFIHGWSCDRSYWNAQIEPFSKQYKVVVIDLAGHGESGLGRKNYTIEAFGADVAAVVKKLGLQRIILIGHSMGGDVIAEAAFRLPGRVLGLVMVDVYKRIGAGRPPEEVQAIKARVAVNFKDSTKVLVRSMFLPTSDASLVERVAEDMSMAPPGVALSALENALTYSRQISKSLSMLKLPVIAINPDNSPTDFESMKHYGVEVMIMPGFGHFLMMENPKRFNDVLKKAIDSLNK